MAVKLISSNIKKVRKSVQKFTQKELVAQIKKGLRDPITKVQSDLIQATDQNLNRRTGTLARSWVRPQVVGKTIKELSVIFINEAVYADIQEHGGKIEAKRAQFLAIPLEAAKTPAGVPRFSSPLRESTAPPMFFAKGILFAKEGNTIVPMFALKKSVEIPPRLGAAEVIDKGISKMVKAAEKAAGQAWDKKGR